MNDFIVLTQLEATVSCLLLLKKFKDFFSKNSLKIIFESDYEDMYVKVLKDGKEIKKIKLTKFLDLLEKGELEKIAV